MLFSLRLAPSWAHSYGARALPCKASLAIDNFESAQFLRRVLFAWAAGRTHGSHIGAALIRQEGLYGLTRTYTPFESSCSRRRSTNKKKRLLVPTFSTGLDSAILSLLLLGVPWSHEG